VQFALDDHGIYNGDYNASKAAGHELKSFNALQSNGTLLFLMKVLFFLLVIEDNG
jgi:hypothetical protein